MFFDLLNPFPIIILGSAFAITSWESVESLMKSYCEQYDD